jgi:hypothetical protein
MVGTRRRSVSELALASVRRHALSIGSWPKWLLPAILIVWVLHTATYAQFERTRIPVLSATRAPVGEVVSISLPKTAGLTPRPTVLIVRLRNRGSSAVHLTVAVGGTEVARPVVPGSRTRRFDVDLPDAAARELSGQLEIKGPGDWLLEYAEVANVHGYSSGVMSFVVIPAAFDRYLRPPPASRWLIAFALLVIGALQRSGRHRGWRRFHLALTVVLVAFLGLTLVAPLATGYAVVLSFPTLLLCAALVQYPGVVQVYRITLRPLLKGNYRAEIAPAGARGDESSLPARSVASRRTLFAAGLVLALASVLVIAAIIRAMEHFVAEGDLAFLGIYTRLALDGRLLVGAYSRFHWHHPGPIYFYVLAPLYWLTGQQPQSLAWTASLINLSSVWLILSRLKRRGGFGVFVAGIVLLLLYLLQAERLFVSPWNPYVALLPLAALVVVCADIASTTHLGALPLIVLLASFITQTHAGYIPCAGALVLASLVLHVWLRRYGDVPRVRGRASDGLYLLASVAVLAVVWAPPVVENLRGDPGNLKFLWHFFRLPETRHVADALRGYAHYMSALPMWRLDAPWWPGAAPRFEWLAWPLTLAQFFLLWQASRWAHLRGRPFHRALCLVSLCGSLAALWSVSRISDDILSHLVFWVSVLSVINLTAIVAVLSCQGWDYLQMRGLIPADWSTRAPQRWLPALLVLMVAGSILPRLAAEQRASGAGSIGVKTAVGDFRSYLDQHGIRRPMLRISHAVWPFAAGFILELSRAGRPVAVESRWIYMYTDAFGANGSEDAEFYLVDTQDEDARSRLEYEPIAGSGRVTINRVYSLGPVQRLAPSSRILDAPGTRGNPAQIVDGRVPADGSDWDSEGTLFFETAQASVTLTVPPAATGVALTADGNDSYRLECSTDGSTFTLVGIVPVKPGHGLQTREGHFRGLSTCQQLRISPDAGDGMFSIAEVAFLSVRVIRDARPSAVSR